MKLNKAAIVARNFRVKHAEQRRRQHRLMLMTEAFRNLGCSAQDATKALEQLVKIDPSIFKATKESSND